MKQGYVYRVIIDEPKFPKIYDSLCFPSKDQLVSVNSLFDYNEKVLLNSCKNKNNALAIIRKMLRYAKNNQFVIRVDSNYIPEWFVKLKSVDYWQSQLRGSKTKNIKSSRNSTKEAGYSDLGRASEC